MILSINWIIHCEANLRTYHEFAHDAIANMRTKPALKLFRMVLTGLLRFWFEPNRSIADVTWARIDTWIRFTVDRLCFVIAFVLLLTPIRLLFIAFSIQTCYNVSFAFCPWMIWKCGCFLVCVCNWIAPKFVTEHFFQMLK